MDREFKYAPWTRYVQALNALCTIGCFSAYLALDGKELVLAMYIPLDLTLNFAKTSYFYYYLYLDRRQKKEKELMQEALDKKSQVRPNDVTEPLISNEEHDELVRNQDN